jgi:hypothetical protein
MQNQTDTSKSKKPVDPTNITKHGEERAPEKAMNEKSKTDPDKGGSCGCG